MKITNAFLLIFLSLACLTSCDSKKHAFEMQVEKVEVLKGFILKGLSLTGPVTHGCIANDDQFQVLRKGKQVFTEVVRVVNVAHLSDSESFHGKVFKGDTVSIYIPDGKEGAVQVGDLIVSNTISCEPKQDNE